MSKKVFFIGDIHGLTEWRESAVDALKRFHEVVFLGDYVDSFHVRPVVQIENLKAIISFLRKKGGTALIGNHDYAYIHGFSAISGYQFQHAFEFKKIFDDNKDLFKVAWGYTDDKGKYTLATHAGLTQNFWNRWVLPEFEEGGFIHKITGGKLPGDIEIHEALNYLIDKEDLMWKVGPRRGGTNIPSPIWTDYNELMENPFPGINQVFGHTAGLAVSLDHIGDEFYVNLDTWKNKTLGSMLISL